ncbi:4-hydroxy-tetrahydrodipicolinate reductase [Bdellovibrio reynosensis]|uniref:4-hydroxy-tetrahydrodipicolinate reductase n=1 Tax=Bdellovibrio reynosensis TaxID=2835041 RepID=A0ABY4CB69_9BACT|nr:dihydrodipicolinate reductase C-terminal domain-containing protein [Bdellovibrio reynosensis]UOF00941.1 dihydrodipicolinate reductase [Bdellovibrio reynosensis]
MPLKVGLLGFGRTGSVVAKEISKDPGLSLEWVCRKTVDDSQPFASHLLGYHEDFAPFITIENIDEEFLRRSPVDLIIDFSSNCTSVAYEKLARTGVRIVSAISNYEPHELELLSKAAQNTAVLYSPNITLGINWLMMASKMLKRIIPHADIEVVEEHFRAKKDISGTALKLAKHLDLNAKEHVNSIRVGGIVGKHEVIFGLPNQTIRLVHESINRAAFGTGAIFAAKWLKDKKSGLYSMENVLQETFLKELNT